MKAEKTTSQILTLWSESFMKNKRRPGGKLRDKRKTYKEEMLKLEVERQTVLLTTALKLGLITVLQGKYFDHFQEIFVQL